MPLDKIKSIIGDIKKGNIKPIYFLMGEEPYYIDGISQYIEKNLLSEEEKGFNQTVLYGRDVSIEDIISNAKRYPMMSERQVVIVKEAQDLSRTIENLVSYAKNPQPTITPKASQMLVEFLGNDLSKVNNELEKLQLILKPGEQITPQIIEENIGISKDFNNFELQNAIGAKDIKKAFAIIQYFSQNPKNNPIVVTLGMLYSFFSKLLRYHALADTREAAKALGVHPYFIKDYQLAARNYPMKKVSAVIAGIRTVDMKSKGVGAGNMTQGDLLKELLIEIFK